MKFKRFFITIIFILTAVFILNFVSRIIFNDFFWGNESLYVKTKIFNQKKNSNSVFVGSSLTWSEYIPEIIDSICSPQKIRSYNLGVGGTRPPETFYYCKYLIENEDSLKNIFIELIPFKFEIQKEKSIYSKNYYYFNIETLYVFQIINFYQSKKWDLALNNIIASIKYSLFNLANINYLETISNYHSKSELEKLVKNEESESTQSGYHIEKVNNQVQFEFKKGAFEKSMKGYTRAMSKEINVLNKSQILFLNYANQITSMGKQRGIHIIWVLSPCLPAEYYNFIIPVYNQINQTNKINMADPEKSKILYSSQFHHDDAHYNTNGAKIYSTLFANEFNILMNYK